MERPATMIRHVIWDWNGTLLDDVEHALIALNSLLAERDMPSIDHARYRERFGFPVRDFYVDIGFDFSREQFERVSELFIARYRIAVERAQTHPEVRATMLALQALGIRQSVLSAMEINLLQSMLQDHDLTSFLTHIRGLDHLHATSKVALGVELMRTLDVTPQETLFIGDTLHDHETASAMGCHCLLFERGHQTSERLRTSGVPLISSLEQVLEFVANPR